MAEKSNEIINDYFESEEGLLCPYCKTIQHSHKPEVETSKVERAICESCGKKFLYCTIVTDHSVGPVRHCYLSTSLPSEV